MLRRIWHFYRDGFRELTPTGRTLWVLILLKCLFVFVLLKLFLFPDVLERDYPDDPSRARAVRSALTQPGD